MCFENGKHNCCMKSKEFGTGTLIECLAITHIGSHFPQMYLLHLQHLCKPQNENGYASNNPHNFVTTDIVVNLSKFLSSTRVVCETF